MDETIGCPTCGSWNCTKSHSLGVVVGPPKTPEEFERAIQEMERRKAQPSADPIDHPPHYKTASGLETIDVIEAFELNFRLGNAIKYILRAGKKGDRIEDLKKARWYLDREIENVNKQL